MSYATVWAGRIATRVEAEDYAAAHEVSTDDTGCSTTLEYALAGAVDTLYAEVLSLRTRAEAAERELNELAKQGAKYWLTQEFVPIERHRVELREAYAKGQRERDTEVAAMIRSFRDAHGEECRCETCVTLIEVVGELLALPIKEHP